MISKVSVIVPIYGTEQYLDNCIQSILSQTMQDFELICVDDASLDNSAILVEKYLKTDNRVSLIKHKENKGLGGARNSGIYAANSEYIICVDSDDTIKKNMLEELIKASKENYFDVVCCGFDEVNTKGKKLHTHTFPNNDFKNSNNNVDVFTIVNTSFCNKLWRLSLITNNEIRFPEKLYFEDVSTTPRVLINAKTIRIIDKSLYNYYRREGTITSTFTSKHREDLFKAYQIVHEYLLKNNLLEFYRNSFLDYVDNSLRFHAQSVVGSELKKSEKIEYLQVLLKHKAIFLDVSLSSYPNTESELLFMISSIRPEQLNMSLHGSLANVEEKPLRLNFLQRSACGLLAILYDPFISPTHSKKLKSYPEFFFKDSKSKFTQIIGKILQIK